MVANFGTWEVVILNVLISHGGKDFEDCCLFHPSLQSAVFYMTTYKPLTNYVADSLVLYIGTCIVAQHGIVLLPNTVFYTAVCQPSGCTIIFCLVHFNNSLVDLFLCKLQFEFFFSQVHFSVKYGVNRVFRLCL